MNDYYTSEKRQELVAKVLEITGDKITTDDPVFALLIVNRELNNQLLMAPVEAVNALKHSIEELKSGLEETLDSATTSAINRLADCIEDGENTGQEVKQDISQFLSKQLATFNVETGRVLEKHLSHWQEPGIRWKQVVVTFVLSMTLSAAAGLALFRYAQSEQQRNLVMFDLQNQALNNLPPAGKKAYLESFNRQLIKP